MTKSHYPGFVAVLCLSLLLNGCGVTSNRIAPANTEPSAGSNVQSIFSFLEDSPADNVVAFRIDATGATLSTDTGTSFSISDTLGTFPMVRANIQHVELRHLNLAPTLAFQTSSVPSGNYTTLNLSFANPQLTVSDSHGNVTRVDGSTTPSVQLTKNSVSIPLALFVNGPVGLMLDFDLQQSIMIDAKGNYMVDPVIIPSVVSESSSTAELEDTEGQIVTLSSIDSSIAQFVNLQMDVQLLKSGQTVHVVANSDIIDRSIGQFVTLRVGQMIELSAQFQKDGTFLATGIGPSSSNPSLTYKGVVSRVQPDSSGNFFVNMILQN